MKASPSAPPQHSDCGACIALCTICCTRAREQAVFQVHTSDGKEHVYIAHAYAQDNESGTVWEDPVVQDLSGASTEFQADVVKEFCRFKLQEGYTVEPYFPADEDPAVGACRKDGDQHQAVPQKSDTPMDVLSMYFHLRIEQAAERLGICPTVLKKICRKHGIARWPYRQVNAIHSRLADVLGTCPAGKC